MVFICMNVCIFAIHLFTAVYPVMNLVPGEWDDGSNLCNENSCEKFRTAGSQRDLVLLCSSAAKNLKTKCGVWSGAVWRTYAKNVV